MPAGIITFKLDGVSAQEAERCRDIIHKLFKANVLNTKGGSATLHFDNLGALRTVEIKHITFKA